MDVGIQDKNAMRTLRDIYYWLTDEPIGESGLVSQGRAMYGYRSRECRYDWLFDYTGGKSSSRMSGEIELNRLSGVIEANCREHRLYEWWYTRMVLKGAILDLASKGICLHEISASPAEGEGAYKAHRANNHSSCFPLFYFKLAVGDADQMAVYRNRPARMVANVLSLASSFPISTSPLSGRFSYLNRARMPVIVLEAGDINNPDILLKREFISFLQTSISAFVMKLEQEGFPYSKK